MDEFLDWMEDYDKIGMLKDLVVLSPCGHVIGREVTNSITTCPFDHRPIDHVTEYNEKNVIMDLIKLYCSSKRARKRLSRSTNPCELEDIPLDLIIGIVSREPFPSATMLYNLSHFMTLSTPPITLLSRKKYDLMGILILIIQKDPTRVDVHKDIQEKLLIIPDKDFWKKQYKSTLAEAFVKDQLPSLCLETLYELLKEGGKEEIVQKEGMVIIVDQISVMKKLLEENYTSEKIIVEAAKLLEEGIVLERDGRRYTRKDFYLMVFNNRPCAKYGYELAKTMNNENVDSVILCDGKKANRKEVLAISVSLDMDEIHCECVYELILLMNEVKSIFFPKYHPNILTKKDLIRMIQELQPDNSKYKELSRELEEHWNNNNNELSKPRGPVGLRGLEGPRGPVGLREDGNSFGLSCYRYLVRPELKS